MILVDHSDHAGTGTVSKPVPSYLLLVVDEFQGKAQGNLGGRELHAQPAIGRADRSRLEFRIVPPEPEGILDSRDRNFHSRRTRLSWRTCVTVPLCCFE